MHTPEMRSVSYTKGHLILNENTQETPGNNFSPSVQYKEVPCTKMDGESGEWNSSLQN